MSSCARPPPRRRWATRLAPLLRHDPVAPPEIYYDRLIGLAAGGIDLWETEYLQILSGPEKGELPVLAWVRGTALRPLLAPLDPADQADFTARYDVKLQRAYKRRANGKTLFPFRRLFLVARGEHDPIGNEPWSRGRESRVAHWLLKSEPFKYSWDQLVTDGRTHWNGVRNYQAAQQS